MTALLTDNLPLLAVAPNGIKKLRELILEFAMRGKLVPQDASDEPAGELLLRISEGKTGSVEKNAAKKTKPRAAVADSAAPYQLPTGWQWSSLAQVAFVNPRNSALDNLEVSFVPMTLIGTRFDGQHGQEFRTWGDVKQGFTHFAEGDVGVAKITPCFENSKACVFAGLRNGLGAGTTELHIVRPVAGTLDARYVLAYLKSPLFLLAGETKMTGTAGQKRLPKEFIEANPFPLPPLGEQSRIVAKVDELMALCDRLEAQQIDAETTHEYLVKALLDSLTQATDAADFAISWQRLSEHFHTLFTTESSVDALKQALLQLAVIGELVPQDSSDEPAHELLKRIAEDKTKLLVGKTKKQMSLKKNDAEERSRKVPKGWEISQFGQVIQLISGQHLGPDEYFDSPQEGAIPYLTGPADFGDVHPRPTRFTHERRATASQGDVLLTVKGSGVGKTNYVEQNELAISRQLMAIRPIRIDTHFTRHLLLSMAQHFKSKSIGIAIPGISREDVLDALVLVPPLPEQLRINSKIEEIVALCDQLKERIIRAKDLNGDLADAAVAMAAVEGSAVALSNVIHVSSYLVRKLASRPTFGRTAHMKWLFLADQHLGLELDMTYERQAAGPLDKLIYQIEEQAAQSQLYATQKETLKSGIEKIVYRPDVAIDRAADAGAAELGNKRAELDRLIGLLGARKTEELEIVATLYAVWNDALAEGHRPDDEWLINEFRSNWHKEKERFSPDLLAKWLSWMREHRLVPAGKTSSTRHQGSLLH